MDSTRRGKKNCGFGGPGPDKMFQRAQMKDFKPLQLPIRLKAHVSSQLKPFFSKNVLAMLRGTDPFLGKEAVLYTAHYDHLDRKSTRLNSSHLVISYAVFCLKKK